MPLQCIFFRGPDGDARPVHGGFSEGRAAAGFRPGSSARRFDAPEQKPHEPEHKPGPEHKTAMRVLHVFKTNYLQHTGGIENAIRQMVNASAAQGIESTILCIGGPEAAVRESGRGPDGACAGFPPCGYTPRVVCCPPSARYDSLAFSRSMFSRFASLSREHDLVHYHFPFPQQDLMHLLTRPSVPTVLTYHSDIVRQRLLYALYMPLLGRFLSGVDAIVATSENYLESSAVLRRFRDKVSVIPLGVDPLSYPEAAGEALARWEAAAGRGFFLFIGVLRYYKGLDILLRAAAKTDSRFVIAGIGPMQSRLHTTARRMGLSNVLFAGMVSEADKAALLTLCRAVVFPSHLRSEAFGLTLVEGAMFGRPLVSCDIGTGTSFINRHRYTGFVVKKGCPDALCEAVEVLARDDRMAETFGRNARKRFLKHFTARQQAERYARLYARLLGRPEPPAKTVAG